MINILLNNFNNLFNLNKKYLKINNYLFNLPDEIKLTIFEILESYYFEKINYLLRNNITNKLQIYYNLMKLQLPFEFQTEYNTVIEYGAINLILNNKSRANSLYTSHLLNKCLNSYSGKEKYCFDVIIQLIYLINFIYDTPTIENININYSKIIDYNEKIISKILVKFGIFDNYNEAFNSLYKLQFISIQHLTNLNNKNFNNLQNNNVIKNYF